MVKHGSKKNNCFKQPFLLLICFISLISFIHSYSEINITKNYTYSPFISEGKYINSTSLNLTNIYYNSLCYEYLNNTVLQNNIISYIFIVSKESETCTNATAPPSNYDPLAGLYALITNENGQELIFQNSINWLYLLKQNTYPPKTSINSPIVKEQVDSLKKTVPEEIKLGEEIQSYSTKMYINLLKIITNSIMYGVLYGFTITNTKTTITKFTDTIFQATPAEQAAYYGRTFNHIISTLYSTEQNSLNYYINEKQKFNRIYYNLTTSGDCAIVDCSDLQTTCYSLLKKEDKTRQVVNQTLKLSEYFWPQYPKSFSDALYLFWTKSSNSGEEGLVWSLDDLIEKTQQKQQEADKKYSLLEKQYQKQLSSNTKLIKKLSDEKVYLITTKAINHHLLSSASFTPIPQLLNSATQLRSQALYQKKKQEEYELNRPRFWKYYAYISLQKGLDDLNVSNFLLDKALISAKQTLASTKSDVKEAFVKIEVDRLTKQGKELYSQYKQLFTVCGEKPTMGDQFRCYVALQYKINNLTRYYITNKTIIQEINTSTYLTKLKDLISRAKKDGLSVTEATAVYNIISKQTNLTLIEQEYSSVLKDLIFQAESKYSYLVPMHNHIHQLLRDCGSYCADDEHSLSVAEQGCFVQDHLNYVSCLGKLNTLSSLYIRMDKEIKKELSQVAARYVSVAVVDMPVVVNIGKPSQVFVKILVKNPTNVSFENVQLPVKIPYLFTDQNLVNSSWSLNGISYNTQKHEINLFIKQIPPTSIGMFVFSKSSVLAPIKQLKTVVVGTNTHFYKTTQVVFELTQPASYFTYDNCSSLFVDGFSVHCNHGSFSIFLAKGTHHLVETTEFYHNVSIVVKTSQQGGDQTTALVKKDYYLTIPFQVDKYVFVVHLPRSVKDLAVSSTSAQPITYTFRYGVLTIKTTNLQPNQTFSFELSYEINNVTNYTRSVASYVQTVINTSIDEGNSTIPLFNDTEKQELKEQLQEAIQQSHSTGSIKPIETLKRHVVALTSKKEKLLLFVNKQEQSLDSQLKSMNNTLMFLKKRGYRQAYNNLKTQMDKYISIKHTVEKQPTISQKAAVLKSVKQPSVTSLKHAVVSKIEDLKTRAIVLGHADEVQSLDVLEDQVEKSTTPAQIHALSFVVEKKSEVLDELKEDTQKEVVNRLNHHLHILSNLSSVYTKQYKEAIDTPYHRLFPLSPKQITTFMNELGQVKTAVEKARTSLTFKRAVTKADDLCNRSSKVEGELNTTIHSIKNMTENKIALLSKLKAQHLIPTRAYDQVVGLAKQGKLIDAIQKADQIIAHTKLGEKSSGNDTLFYGLIGVLVVLVILYLGLNYFKTQKKKPEAQELKPLEKYEPKS